MAELQQKIEEMEKEVQTSRQSATHSSEKLSKYEAEKEKLMSQLRESQEDQLKRGRECIEMQSKMQAIQHESNLKQNEVDRLHALLEKHARAPAGPLNGAEVKLI